MGFRPTPKSLKKHAIAGESLEHGLRNIAKSDGASPLGNLPEQNGKLTVFKSNLAETDCSLPVSFAPRMAECGTVKTLVEAMTSHVDSPLLQAQKLTAISLVTLCQNMVFYGFAWGFCRVQLYS